MRELLGHIPNLGGTKYTGPDMFEIRKLLTMHIAQGWTILSGMDEQCVFASVFGVRGIIGSTLNFTPGVSVEILRWVKSGEWKLAVELQLKVTCDTNTLISRGYAGALREAPRLLGCDCGEPRLPALPLHGEKRAALRERLERLEFQTLARGKGPAPRSLGTGCSCGRRFLP